MTLRVGLLCHWGYGGSSRVSLGLARELARVGHQVHLFARTEPVTAGALGEGIVAHGLAAGASGPSDRLDVHWSRSEIDEMVATIVAVAGGGRLDVLHFHYALPFAAVASQVRRRLGSATPRLVGTLHGTDVSVFGLDPRFRQEMAADLADLDALTTVSHSHAELAGRVFGLESLPEVIPNFVDLLRWSPRSRPRPSGHRPRVIHISNFRAVKAPQAVARIFVAVRREIDAELWLVGDGEEMAAVDAILNRGGVMGDVRHFGLHPDVETILPDADLLLMASRSESFCLAALEAQACAVPVVAPRIGGLPEVVEDGATACLFEPGDERSAADAAIAILRERHTAQIMGRRGAERAVLFAAPVVGALYQALYRRVLAREGAAASPLPIGDHGG